MLFRKNQVEIENWIKNGKDALLVTGARQVGKSFLIRETLKKNHCDFVEFNFIKQKKLLGIFSGAIEDDAEKFLATLRVASRRVLNDDTIIFFDEIQECKEIVTIIKFLVEKGRYKYVLSGSLLGVELNDIRSAPVGYMTTIDMYPMDLEEFFIANGLGEDVIAKIKSNFEEKKPVDPFIHDSFIDAFYHYLIVGGMPEAVETYVDTGDFNLVSRVHRKIARDYKKDFTKYEKKDKLKLTRTYELIPAELDSKNKRYKFTSLNGELKFDRYENSFNWLNDAGVSLPVYNVTEAVVPLMASEKSNLFKLFLSDVGMLTTDYGTSTTLKLLAKDKDINCGAMFENVVAEELKAHGYSLYYYNNKKHGEIDFLIEDDGSVVPLEIKSGKDYETHSALSFFLNKGMFKKGYVLSTHNLSVDGKTIYLPIYMLMFFHSEKEIGVIEKIDLSRLSDRKTGQKR